MSFIGHVHKMIAFIQHKKSKVAMPEYYTLDTLLTLAFQKCCYINILNIICMERVNIFGQRIFFD
ncbi:hypothetical protein DD865_15705, partial [Staphylococcus pseudintermedius]